MVVGRHFNFAKVGHHFARYVCPQRQPPTSLYHGLVDLLIYPALDVPPFRHLEQLGKKAGREKGVSTQLLRVLLRSWRGNDRRDYPSSHGTEQHHHQHHGLMVRRCLHPEPNMPNRLVRVSEHLVRLFPFIIQPRLSRSGGPQFFQIAPPANRNE